MTIIIIGKADRNKVMVSKKHMVVPLLGAKTNSYSPRQYELPPEALRSPSRV